MNKSSIFYTKQPLWKNIKILLEDDVTATILKTTKKANKKYYYFHHQGLHKSEEDFLVSEIMNNIQKLKDVQSLSRTNKDKYNYIDISFNHSLKTSIKILNRVKLGKTDIIENILDKIEYDLLQGEDSTPVVYVSFYILEKTLDKKSFKQKTDKFLRKIKNNSQELKIVSFTKTFKYFKQSDKNYNTKLVKGHYTSVVLKVQL